MNMSFTPQPDPKRPPKSLSEKAQKDAWADVVSAGTMLRGDDVIAIEIAARMLAAARTAKSKDGNATAKYAGSLAKVLDRLGMTPMAREELLGLPKRGGGRKSGTRATGDNSAQPPEKASGKSFKDLEDDE